MEPIPIAFPQLCAMARDHLRPDLTISDAEWSARIKDQVARMRRPYPRPDEITAAMRAVERALGKRGLRRPE